MPHVSRRALLAATSVGMVAHMPEAEAARGDFAAVALKTDFIDRPLGLENQRPRFSWRIASDRRGAKQTAYQIDVATSEAALRGGDLIWTSGRVESDATIDIPYEGPALASHDRRWWRVHTWDEAARAAPPSAITWWEMGLLTPADWRADWIAAEDPQTDADLAAGMMWIDGPAPPALSRKFRLRFALPDAVASATLLVTGKDTLTSVFINGARLYDGANDPPFWGTMRTLDVTTHLSAGDNVIAAAIAFTPEGATAPPAFAALLRVTLHDGRTLRFVSDETWKTHTDGGADWASPALNDSAWPPARQTRSWAFSPPWPALPAQLLRHNFAAPKAIARARLYITALGGYEAWINGARVGDAKLAPESTDFRRRALYQIHDVTDLVHRGDNAIGVMLGDGWYASGFSWSSNRYTFGGPPNRVRAQLELVDADGERTWITTSPEWRTAPAPITASEIYNGETYNARLEQDGWSTAAFNAATWLPARRIETRVPALHAQVSPPIRARQEIQPVSVREVAPSVFVYDMGQNFAGWARLSVRGPRGAQVTLRFAEVLAENGAIDVRNLRGARATDTYILRGNGQETYEPHFTYHGFRYVELTGYPGSPPRDAITGIVAHSDAEITGALRVSDPLIDNIWRNSVWSQKSNLFGVPTDCPQRDERLGWMGDAQVFWNAASYTMDVNAFTRRFMADARAAMTADGAFPDVVPFAVTWDGSPGWANAGVILPHTLYRQYGDIGVIDENWDAMVRWLDHIAAANPDHLWRNKRGIDYGDWLAPNARTPRESPTPKDLIATAFWAQDARLMAEMAAASGRADAAARYRSLFETICAAFNTAYVTADSVVGNGTQTSYALALRFGLLPEHMRARAGEHLAAEVRAQGMKLTTGFLGTPYILDALADTGHEDIAFVLLSQTDYPSWGYMVSKGATSMWERWNGDTGDVAMNSYNHYAFGAVAGFFYRRLAAIEPLEPGFKRILIRPLIGTLARGGGAYQSVRGPIVTDWTQAQGALRTLTVSIPANTSALIQVPLAPNTAIREGRTAVTASSAARLVNRNGQLAQIEIDAGDYSFQFG